MERFRMARRTGALLAVLLAAALPPSRAADRQDDLAAARALFEKNLQAIRDKNRDAYLSCYLDSERLARTGPEGFELGYTGLAASAGKGWPDHIAADDIHLTPVQPGVVYGTYRYRVRYGGREDAGLSERWFVQTPKGWRIAVSTAFSHLPGVPPPPRALVGATLVDGTGAAAGARRRGAAPRRQDRVRRLARRLPGARRSRRDRRRRPLDHPRASSTPTSISPRPAGRTAAPTRSTPATATPTTRRSPTSPATPSASAAPTSAPG